MKEKGGGGRGRDGREGRERRKEVRGKGRGQSEACFVLH